MYRAWSDDYKETVVDISALDNRHRFIAAIEDSLLGFGALGDLRLEEIWWRERIIASNYGIIA